jgi:hypothetical protein
MGHPELLPYLISVGFEPDKEEEMESVAGV